MYEVGYDQNLDFWTAQSRDAQSLALQYIALDGNAAPANYADYFTWSVNN